MSERQRMLLEWLSRQTLPRSSPYACPYLPDRMALQYGFGADQLDGDLYQALMDQGFRRSGKIFYAMDCADCQACVPIRIPVATFRASKSQRRARNKNHDVRVKFAPPQFSAESYQLYRRYLHHQHLGSPQDDDEASFRDMLYSEVVPALEARYYLDTRLIGVSLLDVTPQALSSVYHFFDPDVKERSIGVFSVLAEIDHARELKLPFYYLGYWIQDAPTMHYKGNYRPHELRIGGVWQANPKTPDDHDTGAN